MLAAKAGLDVPTWFVVEAGAFARDDRAHARIEAAARELGGALIVRSSASAEDLPGMAAPGVFASVRDVEPDRVLDAVRTVHDSARSETARAYLDARGVGEARMAVIVQRQVAATLRGTLYSRGADGSPGPSVEVAGDGAGPGADVMDALRRAATTGEEALGGPADMEWAWDGTTLWIVQLRALRPAPPRQRTTWTLETPGTWRWDAEHNPLPLSPAQEGLVELVERRELAATRQRVVHGYLFVQSAAQTVPPMDARALEAMYTERCLPGFRAADERARNAARLGEVLEAYADMYVIYAGVLAPVLSATRRTFLAAVRDWRPGEKAQEQAAELISAPSAVLRLVTSRRPGEAAVFSPEWDVAVPTYGERPGGLVALASRARSPSPATTRDAPYPPALASLAEAARIAARIGEDDDLWFARAQAHVREHLVQLGEEHGLGDDIFWLPLGETRDDGRAAAARERHVWRMQLAVPRAITEGQPRFDIARGDDVALVGRGTGGRVRGIVVRDPHEVNASEPTVFVTDTLIPGHAPALVAAAAAVAEHGGLLGHGAALAREQGIPCVVGCAGASLLAPGDRVLVDGDAGLVIRLR